MDLEIWTCTFNECLFNIWWPHLLLHNGIVRNGRSFYWVQIINKPLPFLCLNSSLFVSNDVVAETDYWRVDVGAIFYLWCHWNDHCFHLSRCYWGRKRYLERKPTWCVELKWKKEKEGKERKKRVNKHQINLKGVFIALERFVVMSAVFVSVSYIYMKV